MQLEIATPRNFRGPRQGARRPRPPAFHCGGWKDGASFPGRDSHPPHHGIACRGHGGEGSRRMPPSRGQCDGGGARRRRRSGDGAGGVGAAWQGRRFRGCRGPGGRDGAGGCGGCGWGGGGLVGCAPVPPTPPAGALGALGACSSFSEGVEDAPPPVLPAPCVAGTGDGCSCLVGGSAAAAAAAICWWWGRGGPRLSEGVPASGGRAMAMTMGLAPVAAVAAVTGGVGVGGGGGGLRHTQRPVVRDAYVVLFGSGRAAAPALGSSTPGLHSGSAAAAAAGGCSVAVAAEGVAVASSEAFLSTVLAGVSGFPPLRPFCGSGGGECGGGPRNVGRRGGGYVITRDLLPAWGVSRGGGGRRRSASARRATTPQEEQLPAGGGGGGRRCTGSGGAISLAEFGGVEVAAWGGGRAGWGCRAGSISSSGGGGIGNSGGG